MRILLLTLNLPWLGCCYFSSFVTATLNFSFLLLDSCKTMIIYLLDYPSLAYFWPSDIPTYCYTPEFPDAAAKSLQSCPTLCDPIDGSPPGSPVPGILQARILEWVAISFSKAWKWKVKVKSLSRVRLLATPWTAAPGSSVHGIFQTRILEWGATAFFENSLISWSNVSGHETSLTLTYHLSGSPQKTSFTWSFRSFNLNHPCSSLSY